MSSGIGGIGGGVEGIEGQGRGEERLGRGSGGGGCTVLFTLTLLSGKGKCGGSSSSPTLAEIGCGEVFTSGFGLLFGRGGMGGGSRVGGRE